MRLLHSLLLVACTVGVAAGGCANGIIADGGDSQADPTPTTDPGTAPATPPANTTGAPVGDGVPCDVAMVLSASCTSCHSGPTAPSGVDLTTYAALVAPSKADPSVSTIQRASLRMKDVQSPMPPTGQLAAAQIAVIDQWIAAGTPKGSCQTPTTPPPVTVQCTSGKTYSGGGDGSSGMDPGRACIACHDQGEGPTFQFAGTIYPTAHEPDNCIGASGATVVVTDANGVQYTATAGASGNFSKGKTNIVFPIHAEVQANGKVLKMTDAINTGDCNSCHTTLGANNAPGRIVAPAP